MLAFLLLQYSLSPWILTAEFYPINCWLCKIYTNPSSVAQAVINWLNIGNNDRIIITLHSKVAQSMYYASSIVGERKTMHFLGFYGYYFFGIFGVLFISLIENLILGAYKLSGFFTHSFWCTCTNQMDFFGVFTVEFNFLICISAFHPPPSFVSMININLQQKTLNVIHRLEFFHTLTPDHGLRWWYIDTCI